MNNRPFKKLFAVIIAGVIIGSLIGSLGLFRIIPKGSAETIPLIAVGLIVLIIDCFCIRGCILYFLRRYVYRNGISVKGIIRSATELPLPKELNNDEWCRRVRYSCIISYKAGAKEYNKEFPPTCLTSKQELYPFAIEHNAEIEIRYMKTFPGISFIDNEKLKAGDQAEHKFDIIGLSMIPLTITAFYIILLIML